MGFTLWATGEFAASRHHLERCLELYAQGGIGGAAHNHDINALAELSWAMWPLGYPDQAVAAIHEAVARAQASGHVPMKAFVFFVEAFLATALGAAEEAIITQPADAVAYCTEHGVTNYELWARFCLGIAVARRGDAREGIDIMRAAMEALAQIDAKILRPLHFGHIAAAHGRLGEIAVGLDLLDEALGIVDATGEHLFEAELHRLRGELLSRLGKDGEAEAALHAALAVARRQEARLWELRAATSLARLHRSRNRGDAARRVLAPIFGWFTEGFATADLRAAKSILDDLP
jgi:predicted ATPase